MARPVFFCGMDALSLLLKQELTEAAEQIDLTIDLIDIPYYLLYTTDESSWRVRAFSRGELYSHDEDDAVRGTIAVDRASGKGSGKTTDKALARYLGAFFNACRQLVKYIYANELSTLYQDLDPEQAGILLAVEDGALSYRVVSGTERPDLMCMTAQGTTVLSRPYREEVLARREAEELERDELVRAARTGDIEAIRELANAYLYGDGEREQHPARAFQWMKELAERGDQEGRFDLGLLYAKGFGCERDLGEAARWMELAQAQGDEDACAPAVLFRHMAEELPRAQAGDAAAQVSLAGEFMILSRSLEQAGPEKDYAESAAWAGRAAAQGDPEGIWTLALAYERGRGVEKDLDRATELYRQGAELGHAQCQYRLGCMYLNGEELERDEERGFGLCLAAAEQGYLPAMRTAGACLQFGNGVSVDMDRAVEWYDKVLMREDDPELRQQVAMYRMSRDEEGARNAQETESELPAEEEPVFTEEPSAEEEPVVGEELPVEEEPVVADELPVEEEPVVAEELPVEEEPVVAEELPVEEEPVVAEEPSVEEEPVVAEEPAAEEEPVVSEELPAEREPVIDEKLPVEEPVAYEEPPAEEEPLTAEEPAAEHAEHSWEAPAGRVERFDEHLCFLLPEDYEAFRGIDNEGRENYQIFFRPSTDQNGTRIGEFIIGVRDQGQVNLRNKEDLRGNFPCALRTSIREVKVAALTLRLLVAVVAVENEGHGYSVIASRVARNEEDLADQAAMMAEHLNAVLGSVELDGVRASFEPLSAERLLRTEEPRAKDPDRPAEPVPAEPVAEEPVAEEPAAEEIVEPVAAEHAGERLTESVAEDPVEENVAPVATEPFPIDRGTAPLRFDALTLDWTRGETLHLPGYRLVLPAGARYQKGLEGRDLIAWIPGEDPEDYAGAPLTIMAGAETRGETIAQMITAEEFEALSRASALNGETGGMNEAFRLVRTIPLEDRELPGGAVACFAQDRVEVNAMVALSDRVKWMRLLFNGVHEGNEAEVLRCTREIFAHMTAVPPVRLLEDLDDECFTEAPLDERLATAWERNIEQRVLHLRSARMKVQTALVVAIKARRQRGEMDMDAVREQVTDMLRRFTQLTERHLEKGAATFRKLVEREPENALLLRLRDALLDMAVFADQTVDLNGERLLVRSRLAEDLRYELDLPELRALSESHEEERTELLRQLRDLLSYCLDMRRDEERRAEQLRAEAARETRERERQELEDSVRVERERFEKSVKDWERQCNYVSSRRKSVADERVSAQMREKRKKLLDDRDRELVRLDEEEKRQKQIKAAAEELLPKLGVFRAREKREKQQELALAESAIAQIGKDRLAAKKTFEQSLRQLSESESRDRSAMLETVAQEIPMPEKPREPEELLRAEQALREHGGQAVEQIQQPGEGAAENALKAKVLSRMVPDHAYDLDQMLVLMKDQKDLTPMRLTALLARMIRDGVLVRTVYKDKSFYSLA